MAEKIVSPGVFTNEVDASFLPAAVGDIGAVVVGPTVKGPALTPTVVSSFSEYQAVFGDVFKSGSSYYSYLTSLTAQNYLRNGSSLTVVRVMGDGFSGAEAEISSSVNPYVVGGGKVHSGSINLTLAGNKQRFVGYGNSHNAHHFSASITAVNAQGVKGDTTHFVVAHPDSASLSSSIASSIGFVSGHKNNSSRVIFVPSGSTPTLTTANLTNAINSHSIHGLPISATSTGTVVTCSFAVDGENGTPGAFCRATDAFGGGIKLAVTASLGADDNPHNGTPSGSIPFITQSGGALATTRFATTQQFQGGSDFSTTNVSFKLKTIGDGTYLNNSGTVGTNDLLTSGTKDNVRFEIVNTNQKKGTFTVVIRQGNDTTKRKSVLETFTNVSLDPNTSNYIGKAIGDAFLTIAGSPAEPFLTYTGEYPQKSKYVFVSDIKVTPDYLDENGVVRLSEQSASLPAGFGSGSRSGSFNGSFSGGSDGTLTHPQAFYDDISSTNTQGFNLGVTAVREQYLKALNLLANADEYDFNLLMIPGIIRSLSNHTSVVTKAVDVCESRGDAFCLFDIVGYGDSITNVKTEAKGEDSNYAATYWPWVMTSDPSLGRQCWVPPSTVVAGMYAFNDKVSHEWFAPAGLNRGTLDTVSQAERKLTQGNRDELYDVNVNPIATFPGQGVVVFGQKTLQKKSSALDRVNVRRLLIRVKKFIAASSRFLLFEQNNAATRGRFLNIANPFLEQVQSQSGLSAFRVVMDDSNNTPDTIDRNQLVGQILLQPTKTAEFITLDFTILPTGAAFPE